MGKIFLIGVGGFIGAVLRYQVSGYVQTLSRSMAFPYGTLAVNVLGCLAIGFLTFFIDTRGLFSPEVRALALIGIIGAFTTYSTFSVETINLLVDGQIMPATANVLANTVIGLVAVWVGRGLPMLLWR